MGNDTSSRLKVPTINAKNNKDVPIQAQGKTDQFLIFSFLLLFNLITSFANEQVLFERFKLALEMLITINLREKRKKIKRLLYCMQKLLLECL